MCWGSSVPRPQEIHSLPFSSCLWALTLMDFIDMDLPLPQLRGGTDRSREAGKTVGQGAFSVPWLCLPGEPSPWNGLSYIAPFFWIR